MIVHLTRAAKDVPADELSGSLECFIRTHTDRGEVMPIAGPYLDQLKASGWKGMEQIPTECIVRGWGR